MRNKKLIILFCILTLVTLLIVLGSVVFSVKGVYASCYNADDEALDKQVASMKINGIEEGKSIFLLDEDEIIKSIESKVSGVKVINVERKFPNQVYVNYVKVYPYFVIERDDKAIYATNEGKVISTSNVATSYPDQIKYIGKTGLGDSVGDTLYQSGDDGKKVFTIVTSAIEKIAKYPVAMEMFELVDTTDVDEMGKTYFVTRTGVVFELQGGRDNLLKKLRLAVSVYASDETKYKSEGTIIINASGSRADYTKENRYTA